MSLPAIKLNFWPSKPLHLDIGRTHLTLDDGKKQRSLALSSAMKPGLPGDEALAALGEAINTLLPAGVLRQGTLNISVSDAFSRCWILPRLSGLASIEELNSLARHQLKSIFGDSETEAAEWITQLDELPFAQAWPVIALPRKLVDLCQEQAMAKHYRLISLQPRFVQASKQPFFRLSLRSRGQHLVEVLTCDESVTLGIRRGIHWLSLRVHPPLASLGLPIETLIKRDCQSVGISLESCLVRRLNWPAGNTQEREAA